MMKLLSLSVALALGAAASFAQASQGDDVNLAAKRSVLDIKQGFTQSDLTSKTNVHALKQRLNKYGLNKQNRPHLFSVIDKQYERAFATPKATIASMNSSNECGAHNASLCSFFKHMGVEVATLPGTNEDYLVVSALNSEKAPTNYTFIDITLVNEKGQSITLPRYAEFFGDGDEKKRKSIYSSARLSDAVAKLQSAERIYADAWVTIVYTDAAGNEVVEDRNSKVEYSKETLLGELGLLPVETQEVGVSVIEQDVGIMRTDFGSTLSHPKDLRSKAEAQLDNKIIICLNRNYGDCDYENIYPHGTPNDQLKLKIPFVGEYILMGKVTRIYRPDWSVVDVVDNGDGSTTLTAGPQVQKPDVIDFGSNIFIQTKEGGGATSISGDQYSDIQNFFADSINVEYIPFGRRTKTKLSWNIPRNQGVFGDASLYGRYQDANWIMNIAVDNEPRPGQTPRAETVVIGSAGLGSWEDIDYPQMQIVYSCLAEGSLITLPNGTQMPIEKLSVGDQVLGASQYTPANHLALDITDISVGVEAIPMVELKTKSGKKLLLTESHPVIMQSGHSIWANEVQLGDRIHTQDGVEFVSKITQVKFKDKVYNLRLARSTNDPKYLEGETFSMFANGLQVGDLTMQSNNEFKDDVETEQDVLIRLPEPWHKDYLNSIK
ncbi:hypothetical protein PSECIP111854_03933 [Pseudoalteromonas sp. CIP111854]|uniref:Hint domain-containing protein n=1 Tax=Pseudoalteromonas holothuriae TaxID=2963714 RepID=A0A9W4R4X8_9GAMM|nr:Hint domain-containing protein [Pseudoalteromonas sp. CIP111854]CAH9066656.1 hypothetical protein PSECIP111854_03933 [Pseudoalteromonas sp. CIP111854]